MSRATVASDEQRQRAERKGKCDVSTSAWDAPPQPRASGGGGDLLKIEDGKSVVLAVVSEPLRVLTPKFGEGPGGKLGRRVFATVYDFSDKRCKVWNLAPSVFEDLKAIHKEAPFSRHAVKLTRSGTGEATQYRIVPVLKPLTSEAFDAIKAASKPDMAAVCANLGGEVEEVDGEERAASAPSGAPEAGPVADEDIPF